jgi:hypothetical protein
MRRHQFAGRSLNGLRSMRRPAARIIALRLPSMMFRAVFKAKPRSSHVRGQLLTGPVPEAAQQEPGAEELAKKTQNPVAELISVPMQNHWNFGAGFNHNKTIYLLNVQPVLALWFEIVCCLSEVTVYEGLTCSRLIRVMRFHSSLRLIGINGSASHSCRSFSQASRRDKRRPCRNYRGRG